MSDDRQRFFLFVRVYSCTRAGLIESGELIDVSTQARDFGFKADFHITKNAWKAAVAWTDEDSKRTGKTQSVRERLAYLLWNAKLASERDQVQPVTQFTIDVIPNGGSKSLPEPLRLHLLRELVMPVNH